MQKYPWKRFWCSPEGSLHIDHDGFLSDPEHEYAKYFNSDARSFEEIKPVPCLILLGEPGIGKSLAIEDEILNTRLEINGKDDDLISLNLKEFNSEDRLWNALFENDVWHRYKQGTHNLHLFLDSLDEVRIRIHSVQNMILRGLRESPIERLSFRIICRTAEWPSTFRDELCKLWTPAKVKTYELSPLRYQDVEQAAELKGINTQVFMNTVSERNIGPLTAKPITLVFLLSLFEKEGQLPASTNELYEKGCLLLCAEPDKERQEKADINTLYAGRLTPQERMISASRIAAILILNNSIGISKNVIVNDVPDGYLRVADLTDRAATFGGTTFNVNKDAVIDTLKTGLFTSRGEDLFVFSHQTYADFLAARYLEQTPLKQVMSLVTHPYDRNRIIPQLHEMSAWLATRRSDVMHWILSIEPEVVLRSDIKNIDNVIKEIIVTSLLARIMNEELFDSRTLREDYHKLAHPTITGQLKPLLIDKAASLVSRRAAIDITEACKVITVQENLAEIALDVTENYHLIIRAADAFCEVADDCIKDRFEPLARGELGDDPDDELRACGMICMWPKYWNIVELLRNVIPQKNTHFIGSYSHFLRYEAIQCMPKEISIDDICMVLPIVSSWIKINSGYELRIVGKIYDEVIRASWVLIPNQEIMKQLSGAILQCLKEYKPIYGQDEMHSWSELAAYVDKKHEITSYMINSSTVGEEDIFLLTLSETPLIVDDDFFWLLDELEKATILTQPVWTKLILSIVRQSLPEEWISHFLEVHLRVPILKEAYQTYWELDSELSRNSKAAHLKRMRWEDKNKRKPPIPPIPERIEAALRKIESGTIDEWFKLTHYLWLDQETGAKGENWKLNIKESPGWIASNETIHARIAQSAIKFVLNYSPDNDEWFGKGSWTIDMFSIYTALLLVSEETEIMDNPEYNDWDKWVPYCIDNPVFFNTDVPHCQLFMLAYKKRPEMAKEYLLRLMRNGKIDCLVHLEKCWNSELTLLAMNICASETINPDSFRDIARLLVKVGAMNIETMVVDKFTSMNEANENDRAWLRELGVLILEYWSGKYWSLIWVLFQKNQALAEEILGEIAMSIRHIAEFIDSLNTSNMADLYRFMNCRFTPEEDLPLNGGAISHRQMLADLRNTIFNKLVDRGTREACSAIESLIKDFPDQRSWLMWKLREAESITLRKTWVPLRPSEIIDFLKDPNKRFVETEEDLLFIVLESLKRFQESCKSQSLPSVDRFWNYQGSGNNRSNFTPKDEEDLSNEIARWIRDDLGPSKGVIVNREVQPRRGQETDIYINAVAPNSGSQNINALTIVVEVKGCWNSGTLHAMKTQLADRYMNDNSLSCGLYIVGWYMCEKWTDTDYRKKDVCKKTPAELEEFLNKQARNIIHEIAGITAIRSFILDLTL